MLKNNSYVSKKAIIHPSVKIGPFCYIGDDVNCFELLSNVGIAACPENAMQKIKSIPNIIQLRKKGGEGVVRELVELILS